MFELRTVEKCVLAEVCVGKKGSASEPRMSEVHRVSEPRPPEGGVSQEVRTLEDGRFLEKGLLEVCFREDKRGEVEPVLRGVIDGRAAQDRADLVPEVFPVFVRVR